MFSFVCFYLCCLLCVCTCVCTTLTNFPLKKNNIQIRLKPLPSNTEVFLGTVTWEKWLFSRLWPQTPPNPAVCPWCVSPHKEVFTWRQRAGEVTWECFVLKHRGFSESYIACQQTVQPVQREAAAARSPGAPAYLLYTCNQSVFSSRLVT